MTDFSASDPATPQGVSPAGWPRRPTPDPNVFVIPREELPPDFAERLGDPVTEPVPPRPAATVVLLREDPAAGAPEVLLLRRHRRSGFAADAWVFPGGVVDEADMDPALPVLCDGPEPDAWAERLGVRDPDEAFGYVMAALREAFEETGILLAREGIGADEERDAAAARGAVDEFRDAVLAGEVTLREIAAQRGLRYATDQLLYLAHWITPTAEPRRYDTRFFLAPLPHGQEYALHEPELVEARWLSPAEAVDRFHTGELKMLPPTVHTLRRLAEFRSLAALRDALTEAPVPTFLPHMRRTPEGVVIEVVEDRNEERGTRKER
ncbi:hypothetical protein BH23GEM7_BH23GEM7_20360 [soil metagenome]